ncbi:TadE/TadG family type IV pilus assembly protein [Variovorax sp. LT1R20]|uniref:TadE/TadG family type IV pilus assembly protein n=1 Tax=Variovorax sp. LT1R20 TaxID=3443729 RepID=UPI003F44E464
MHSTLRQNQKRSLAWPRRGQRGVSMTETMIALPVLILFVMCVVQFGLIYRARLTLEYAAHEAARAGSLNNGMPLPFIFRIGNSTTPGLSTLNSAALELTTNALTRGSVWQGLVKGMMPLNVREASVGGMFKGWIDTNTDLIESACIEYLNPTQTTFIDWAFIENFGENRWIMQIPNDTMRYRKPLPYDFKAKAMSTTVGIGDPLPPDAELRGNVSNKTLGESSVLHLRVHYGYRLGIPVANKIILTALKGYQFVGEAWFKLMSVDGATAPGTDFRLNQLDAYYIANGKIPLAADGVAGMESPMYWHPFYSFGPRSDRSIDLQWDPAWSNNTGINVLEKPQDAMTNIFAFVRNNSTEWASQLLARGVDAAADKVGDGNNFCPAIWDASVKGQLDKVPNPGKAP